MDNYGWLELIPSGWKAIGRKMIQEIEKVNPNYEIVDMKEKWGALRTYGFNEDDATYDIVTQYEKKSSHICCRCGATATKYSLGYILPWCDECGIDESKYYIRFNEELT